MAKNKSLLKLVYSAVCLALAMVLPLFLPAILYWLTRGNVPDGTMVNVWYYMIGLVFLLWRCYTKPRLEVYRFGHHYYISQFIAMLVMILLAIVGIRGSITAGTRPITISNANQYVNRPVEASVVLNTPFSTGRVMTSPSLYHSPVVSL